MVDSTIGPREEIPGHHSNRRIRVLVVDPDAQSRAVATAALGAEHDIHVVAQVGNPDECWQAVRNGRPDVIVLDLHLGASTKDGILLASQFSEAFQTLRIVFRSDYLDEHYAAALISRNVLGYVSKSDPPSAVVEAVRTAARHGTYLSQSVYDRIAGKNRPD